MDTNGLKNVGKAVRTPKWKGSQRNRRTLYNWLINDLE
jgi:hypothetical protein